MIKFLKTILYSLTIILCFHLSLDAQTSEEESLEDILNTKIDAAAKYSQTIDEAPASITVITHTDISNYGYQTLDEVLSAVPGFYTTLDRNYGYIGTRGFGRPTDYNNRILILINGNKINENFYGYVAVWTDLAIDLKSLERIEIVRGPGSALYGNGAMLAVINLVTKTGATINGTEMNVRGGSHGNVGADLQLGRAFSDESDWMMSIQWEDVQGQDLYFKEFDAPETNSGIAQDLDWNQWYGLLTTYRKNGFFLQASAASAKKGIPTGSYETTFNSPLSETVDQRQSLALSWNKQLNTVNLIALNVSWNRYHYTGSYPYQDGFYSEENIGQWLETELRWQWDIAPENRFIAGTEYVYNPKTFFQNQFGDDISFEGNFPYYTFSFYAQDEHQIHENIAVTLGVRYDNALKDDAISPRIALIYQPQPKSTFKLLYGKAFRSPNVYETHYANNIFKSNPSIRPEHIQMLEGIWQQRLNETIQTEVSIYRYKMEDLIDTAIDPSDDLLVFRNINNVVTNGVEISAMLRTPRGLQGYASYSYENAKDEGTQLVLTNSPKHLAKLVMVVPLTRKYQAAAEFRYESGRRTVYDTETKDVILTNLTFRAFIPSGVFNSLPITLKINNLFDVDYSTPGGFEHRMPEILQNGRTFLLDVGFRFDFK